MNSYSIALFAHVLLVIYLLGADLGRAYVAHLGASGETGNEARWLAARVVVWLGSATNLALVLMLPVGVSLGAVLGVFRISDPAWLVATWVVALVWLTISLGAERAARVSGRRYIEFADIALRILIAAGFVYDGIIVFLGLGETVQDGWLASKIMLYGLLIFLSIPVRWISFNLVRAKAQGDTTAAQQQLGRLRAPILLGWALILLAAWFGVAKP